MPVFLLMLFGWYLGKIGMLTEEFIRVSNRFVFQAALPVLLFQDIASADIHDVFDIRFLLFCMISTTVCFFTIWGAARLLMKEKDRIGAFVQGSFRGSAAILGVAFIQNMYGNSGMAPLMIIGAVPLFNIYSVLVLTFEGEGNEQSCIKSALFHIMKNPIILGIVIGMAGSLLHIYQYLPPIVEKPLASLASIASPLALIVIGGGFEGGKVLQKAKPVIIATVVKLVGMPLVCIPIAIWLGFRKYDLIAFLIMLGAPTTVTSYIMAVNMKNDGVLASGIVVLSTVFSAITLTGWIFLLKAWGMV